MGQITSRVSDELEAALNRWAAEEGCQRSDLIRNLLTEAADARKGGGATSKRPQLPGPADIQHLAAKVHDLSMELDRILRQNAERDSDLACRMKADTVGVSEARTAIIGELTAEMRRVLAAVATRLAAQPAELISALVASPAMVGIAASLGRLEEQPGLKEICTYQQAQTIAIRTVNASVEKAHQQPRVQKNYAVFGGNWTGRMAAAGSVLIGVAGVVLFLGLAMVLPPSWLALRIANQLLGGGDQAICALVDYRTATNGCRTHFEGRPGRMVVSTRVARQ